MKIKQKLSYFDFECMYKLESKYYSDDHITPVDEAFLWYKHFPHNSTVLENEGQIIGFLDMFPIKNELFDNLKAGTFNDANLTLNLIEDITKLKPGDKTNMFLCCIVIDEKYRKTDAMNLLFKTQIDYFQTFVEKGIEIEYIITDNVTPEGVAFSKRLGFEKVCDTLFESTIFMDKYNNFINNFLYK